MTTTDEERGADVDESQGEQPTQGELTCWARSVIGGKTLLDAVSPRVAFSQTGRAARVALYLEDRETRDSVLRGLALSGQGDRAEEILRYYATLAASDAIEKGDSRVILAMLPKGSGRAKKASEEVPELPSGGRSLK